MIIDSLDQAFRYASLHPDFQAAFAFLRNCPLRELEEGRHEIEEDRIFALVSRTEGRGIGGAKLEAHQRYIDIQVVVEGNEVIGWRRLGDCARPESAFDVDRDIVFFEDPAECWIAVAPGRFAIFFPQDAHAPLAGDGPVLKVVIKVAV